MKKEELTALWLEQDVIDKIFAMNGKDIAAEKAKLAKVEGERDNYKAQLDTAKEILAKFDGVSIGDLKGQITKLQEDIKASAPAHGVWSHFWRTPDPSKKQEIAPVDGLLLTLFLIIFPQKNGIIRWRKKMEQIMEYWGMRQSKKTRQRQRKRARLLKMPIMSSRRV